MKSEKTCGVSGRPRGFCVDSALDKALQVFWQKGYDGASLTDLTQAMGINRPSLYAAYGNKENLFIKALDRYQEVYGKFVMTALEQPTAREVVQGLLVGGLANMSSDCGSRGCLGVQAALSCSDEAKAIKVELSARRAKTRAIITERFRRAKDEGDLPSSVDPDSLALYISTIMQGMSIQATDGVSREDLEKAVNIVIQTFDIVVGP